MSSVRLGWYFGMHVRLSSRIFFLVLGMQHGQFILGVVFTAYLAGLELSRLCDTPLVCIPYHFYNVTNSCIHRANYEKVIYMLGALSNRR
jgi:hypothetical protein